MAPGAARGGFGRPRTVEAVLVQSQHEAQALQLVAAEGAPRQRCRGRHLPSAPPPDRSTAAASTPHHVSMCETTSGVQPASWLLLSLLGIPGWI